MGESDSYSAGLLQKGLDGRVHVISEGLTRRVQQISRPQPHSSCRRRRSEQSVVASHPRSEVQEQALTVETSVYCLQAAAELLIAQHWLQRTDFTRRFVTLHNSITVDGG
jgi:hypothetical protein